MRQLIAKVAALTLATAGALVIAGPATAQAHQSRHSDHVTTVLVHGDGTTVTLSRKSVTEGRIAFKVNTTNTESGGSQITLFRLVGHATLATFKADLAKEFSPTPTIAAKGTRDLTRHARFFGLADVSPGTSAKVTETLTSGRYYLMDLGKGGASPPNPVFTTFTVRHAHSDWQGGSSHNPVVKMTSADTFVSPRRLPARGTVTVKNVSDTLHFMSIGRVKRGTTDKMVQDYFDSGSQEQPAFLVDGPSVGLDVLSPGRQADLSYNLPKGTYLLLCFIADDKTGMPHALMGMHKIVTLR